MSARGGLAELAINAVLGCLCPRDGSLVADVALPTRVILALAVALAAVVSGAVGCWLHELLAGSCDPAWTVESPVNPPSHGPMCTTCRTYKSILGLG